MFIHDYQILVSFLLCLSEVGPHQALPAGSQNIAHLRRELWHQIIDGFRYKFIRDSQLDISSCPRSSIYKLLSLLQPPAACAAPLSILHYHACLTKRNFKNRMNSIESSNSPKGVGGFYSFWTKRRKSAKKCRKFLQLGKCGR